VTGTGSFSPLGLTPQPTEVDAAGWVPRFADPTLSGLTPFRRPQTKLVTQTAAGRVKVTFAGLERVPDIRSLGS
jgi:hypothetical protein